MFRVFEKVNLIPEFIRWLLERSEFTWELCEFDRNRLLGQRVDTSEETSERVFFYHFFLPIPLQRVEQVSICSAQDSHIANCISTFFRFVVFLAETSLASLLLRLVHFLYAEEGTVKRSQIDEAQLFLH